MNALDAEGLNTFYGKSHILHDVGLTVAEGRITTLLGRNGAGKTHDAAQPGRSDAAAQRARRVFGQDTTGLPTLSHRRHWASATCRRAGASSPT